MRRRVGLCGCAHIHIGDAIAALGGRADVVCPAVWDRDGERAARVAGQLGAEVAGSVEALIAAVDAAVVMSETADHPTQVGALIDAGLDVFVEKPLAIAATKAAALAARIEEAGVAFDTGYFTRELPSAPALRAAIAAGELGRVIRARGRFVHDGALAGGFAGFEWMLDPARAGRGGLADLGVHLIDLITWLCGERVGAASAAISRVSAGATIDETGAALLRLSGGALVAIEAGWVEPPGPIVVEVSGTSGRARLADGSLEIAAGGRERSLPSEVRPASAAALRRFLDTLAGDRDPGDRVEASVAARHAAVIEACYESARTGRWVDVEVAP